MTDAPLIRADLHNHSYYSPDSVASPEQLLRRAKARGIDVLAVTDHDTTRGGLVA
ncbi:MAG TPA: PHP domain-containing protein, partial [Dehalococcoidia bacterium]